MNLSGYYADLILGRGAVLQKCLEAKNSSHIDEMADAMLTLSRVSSAVYRLYSEKDVVSLSGI